MDDQRYRMTVADNRAKGLYMVIRETIRDHDGRVSRDSDFTAEYFDNLTVANKRLDELNASLL